MGCDFIAIKQWLCLITCGHCLGNTTAQYVTMGFQKFNIALYGAILCYLKHLLFHRGQLSTECLT